MILSDKDIREAIKSGEIGVENSERKIYIGPSSVDMCLRGVAKRLKKSDEPIDPRMSANDRFEVFPFEELIIYPGEFYILCTEEKITLAPNIAGFVQGRSSIARMGINVHAAGFADPGFTGTITLEVTNMTSVPIKLLRGMRICQIVFAETKTNCEIPYDVKLDSKYNGQLDPEISKIQLDK